MATTLTDYQRAALGFGSKADWPNTEAFRRDNIGAGRAHPGAASRRGRRTRSGWRRPRSAPTRRRASSGSAPSWTRSANITNVETTDRPISDSVGGQGSDEAIDFGAADAMAIRRAEDERYAWFMEATVIQLDLPDAVFRGYEGDEQLLGAVRDDDLPPIDAAAPRDPAPRAADGLLPAGHRRPRRPPALPRGRCRPARRGPPVGHARARTSSARISFYEDFPYAWWRDFSGVADLPRARAAGRASRSSRASSTSPTCSSASRPACGMYASQIVRLFDSEQGMLDDLAGFHARTAVSGGQRGFAERTWAPVRP